MTSEFSYSCLEKKSAKATASTIRGKYWRGNWQQICLDDDVN